MPRILAHGKANPGVLLAIVTIVALVSFGCQNTRVNLAEGPAPWRFPRPQGDSESYEDCLTGGEVFTMYCNQCHNARALAERPFANYENVLAHMRVRAQLTGTEHAKLLEFLRRFHDIPSPTGPVEPSPKRLIFSQPMSVLREDQAPQNQPANAARPQPAEVQPPPPPPPVQVEPIPAAPAAAAAPAGRS